MRRLLTILLTTLLPIAVALLGLNWLPGLFVGGGTDFELRAEDRRAPRRLAEQLAEKKFILSPKLFRAALVLFGADKKLESGVYHFEAKEGLVSMVRRLKKGDAKKVNVTFKEGDDLFDMAKAAAAAGAVATEGDFLRKARAKAHLDKIKKLVDASGAARGGLENLQSAEGFIYPDTYRVKAVFGGDELLQAATARFQAEILPLWNGAPEGTRTLLQVLTAASLVEKETGLSRERPLVASVLANRLARGEKLRYDPTILYALKLEGRYKETQVNGHTALRASHMGLPSPWNTYVHAGLPPTPICSPTAESVQAALRPPKTDFYFFVAKGDGSREHTFTRTYEEHLKAVANYREKEKQGGH